MPDPDRISSITRLLEKAYLEEEEYWKQRSRIQWLQCGDRNSGYFHAITRGRKQVNKLSIMEDDQGLICDNEEGIVRIISSYFQSIFTSSGTDCIETVHEAISPCIPKETNDLLTTIPDREEVRRAVYAIQADKAPGLDGFSASFY